MPARAYAENLSAIDAAFLRVESETALMHIGWSAVFSAAPDGRPPTVSGLRARALARLHWMPRFRQRLAGSPVGPLGDARWVDDERFDIAEHILTPPGADEPLSAEAFGRLRDRVLSQPLDRGRPLWQVVLVPRLEDGGIGVVGRVHHAMADGTAALLVATLLLDR
ncbi:MAG: acyltransferase, partial [Solirubrobacterales bacterium]|nr:acyltransferase [Solirubrobacterales bacterium]